MNDKASQTQVPRWISMGARRRPVTGDYGTSNDTLWQSMLAGKNATILWELAGRR